MNGAEERSKLRNYTQIRRPQLLKERMRKRRHVVHIMSPRKRGIQCNSRGSTLDGCSSSPCPKGSGKYASFLLISQITSYVVANDWRKKLKQALLSA